MLDATRPWRNWWASWPWREMRRRVLMRVEAERGRGGGLVGMVEIERRPGSGRALRHRGHLLRR